MRRRLLVLAMMLAALTGLMPAPAYAALASDRYAPATIGPPRSIWKARGVMATMNVVHHNLDCGNTHVESIYVSRDLHDPWPSIEFGWTRDREWATCAYGPYQWIIRFNHEDGSQEEARTVTINTLGAWRFRIDQDYPTYAGRFRFFLTDPNGNNVPITTTYTPPSSDHWDSGGSAQYSMENESITDEAGDYFANTWFQKFVGGGWYPANTTYNAPLYYVDSMCSGYSWVDPHIGLEGDLINYVYSC